jgi:hypothetical protein
VYVNRKFPAILAHGERFPRVTHATYLGVAAILIDILLVVGKTPRDKHVQGTADYCGTIVPEHCFKLS